MSEWPGHNWIRSDRQVSNEAGSRDMENSLTNRPRLVRHKDASRSRVGNGSALLTGVDGRSAWMRRAKDLIADYKSDYPDASIAENSIIRRACILTVELERFESKFANAGAANDYDLDLYQRTVGNLRRLLESVGLKRRQKDVTTLDSYLATRHAKTELSDG
jgi:hypothetical protein